MDELLPCPFCGMTLTKFGRDRIRGVIEDTVIHPGGDNYCPLNELVFPIKQWNTRAPDPRVQRLVEAGKQSAYWLRILHNHLDVNGYLQVQINIKRPDAADEELRAALADLAVPGEATDGH
jgi:hypothetical protein